MAHVFGDNEKESDYGYVYKVSGPRTYCSPLSLCAYIVPAVLR